VNTKIRIRVQFLDGVCQWVNLDAARGDNLVPLIVYAHDKKLTASPGSAWTLAFTPGDITELSNAYATKAE
jgi:hypothetical protein